MFAFLIAYVFNAQLALSGISSALH